MSRTIKLLLMMASLVVLCTGVALAAFVQCDGPGDRDPRFGFCQGTDSADDIEGNNYGERISAMAGNDSADGNGGNDEMHGGQNNDGTNGINAEFEGGSGNDQLFGEAGNDRELDGDSGNDVIRGGPGDDGDRDANDIDQDSLRGEGGENVVRGEDGNDGIDAQTSAGADGDIERIFGGSGNDVIIAEDDVVDIIDCGSGRDTVDFDRDLDTIRNCEVRNPSSLSVRAQSDAPGDDDVAEGDADDPEGSTN